MKKNCIVFLIMFLMCLIRRLTFAETAPALPSELALFEEIPIVTLATRLPQPITEAPAAINVITADDIAHSGYTNIWDLLRSQPGVDVFQMNGNFVGVAVRGFNDQYSEKLQVLVDGRTVFDPINNGMFWKDPPILLEDIERIEIMRGPDSVMYGYNAFNGIINIISKDPEKTKGVLTKVTAGSHSTQQYYGRFGDTIGKLDYRLSYERDNSQGLGDHGGKGIIDGERMNTVSWRSRYTISEDKNLEFFAGAKTGIGGEQGTVDSDSRHRVEFQQLKYNQVLSKDSGFFIQFFRNYLDKNLVDTSNQHDIAFKQYDLEFQHNFKAFDKHSFVWGGNFRRNEGRIFLNADPVNFYHDRILRVFGQDAITLTDKLTYYSGLEWAQNNYTGTDWSTRQTLMYKLFDDHYLRATYGRAYHAFGFIHYYASLLPFVPVLIGNPNLERESINAYELGYRGTLLNRKLSFDFEFFYNDIDKIKANVSPLVPFSTTLGNGNRAEVVGFETSLEYKPFDWLKTYFNHSYLSVDDKKGEWKFRDPKHKVNLGVRLYMKEKYLPDYLDMKFYYVGRIIDSSAIKVPPYYKLDLHIAKKFCKDKVEFAFTALNLLDSHHYEFGNTITVDRAYYGSVKIEF
ncbi:MAG: TonB-dependent receptor [Candidatus Omnitrophota bacterium]